jgi:chromosomal replication initiator protein
VSVSGGDVTPVNAEAQTWAVVLGELRNRLPQSEFDTWMRGTALVELAGTEAIVAAPHIFARDMLENTYGSLITSSLHHVLGFPVQLQIVIG